MYYTVGSKQNQSRFQRPDIEVTQICGHLPVLVETAKNVQPIAITAEGGRVTRTAQRKETTAIDLVHTHVI